jgi:hypothetical protein
VRFSGVSSVACRARDRQGAGGGDDETMFTELTDELLDLTATEHGYRGAIYARLPEGVCASCCCCKCLFWC